MSTIDSLKNALFSLGKKSDQEKLVIPVDGYADEDEDRAKKRFYGLKINNIRLLLNTDIRSEVMNDVTVTPIPLMPDFVKGLCNVRGNLIPVYDLHKKFGLTKPGSTIDNTKVLVLDEKHDMAAVEIDEMLLTLNLDEQDRKYGVKTDNDIVNQFITYSYRHDDHNWFAFDHKKIFKINSNN